MTDAAGNGYVIGNGWIAGRRRQLHGREVRARMADASGRGSSRTAAAPSSPGPGRSRCPRTRPASWSRAAASRRPGTRSPSRCTTRPAASGCGTTSTPANMAAQDVAFSPDGASVYVGNTEICAEPDERDGAPQVRPRGQPHLQPVLHAGHRALRLAVDGAGNVVATGTASPLPGSAYRDWMTIKTDAGGRIAVGAPL